MAATEIFGETFTLERAFTELYDNNPAVTTRSV